MYTAMQLPCGHEYCKSCMAQLREKRVAQTCPLCRKPLPPGPDKLYDLGWRIYAKIVAVVDPDENADWDNITLSPVQQRGMDQSRALMLEAAAQGHMMAQAVCADIYSGGRGVARDERLAFVYHEMAAQQGHMKFQYNMGVNYLQRQRMRTELRAGCGVVQESWWSGRRRRHGRTWVSLFQRRGRPS